MSCRSLSKLRRVINAVKFFDTVHTTSRSVYFYRKFNTFTSNSLTSFQKEKYFLNARILKHFHGLNNKAGAPKVAPLTLAKFHTSKSRRSIGPLVYALFKPIVNVLGIIIGRRFKSWWSSLPPSRKKEIADSMKAHTQVLIVGSIAFTLGCYCFYLLHLSEAPITKRKRFIVYSKAKLLQISEIQNNLLQTIHNKNMLPSSSLLYKKITIIVNQILRKNQDIAEIRNVPWTVYVVSDPLQKNVFVLPDGSIYVFTGIFDVCKNDDQLAFVLAHEISHVLMSHVEENISKTYFMEMLVLIPILMFWATLPGEMAIISHWITNRMNHIMITLPFCRSIEMEADYVALQLVAKACYDVREASRFWNNMIKLHIYEPPHKSIEWLSTHPNSSKREQFLNELMPAAIRLRDLCECPPLKKYKNET